MQVVKKVMTIALSIVLVLSMCIVPNSSTVLAAGTNFYVSPSGSDSNVGTRWSPWKTISKVNNTAFAPGDRVLFQGGETFNGNLTFDQNDGGSDTLPVTITSYGTGRATINAGDGHGIKITGATGINVENIIVVGSGRNFNNRGVGVFPTGSRVIRIDNVEASGFQLAGFMITGGCDDVRLTNSYVHGNGYTGIGTGYFYDTGKRNTNIYIGYCKAHSNPGISNSAAGFRDQSGSGINLYRTDNSLVEYCDAYNNGYDFVHSASNGPVGIWLAWCTNVTVQHCISRENRTCVHGDGGGFDLDSGSKNCLFQYNYSYGNHGAGFLICAYNNTEQHRLENNTIRYCVSENDGQGGHQTGISIYNGDNILNTHIYNNIIYNSGGRDCIKGWPRGGNMTFRNNIFLIKGSGYFVNIDTPTGAIFQGNCYWNYDRSGKWYDGTTTYTSFADWSNATGQEMLGATLMGINIDPQLTNPGNGEKLIDPTLITQLSAYKLLPDSLCIDSGLNLSSNFSINPGTRDFYDGAIPNGGEYDIGVHEYSVSTSTPSPTVSPTPTPTPAPISGHGANLLLDGDFDAWNGYSGVNNEIPAIIAETGYGGYADELGRWVANPGYVVPAGAGAWQWVSSYKPDTDYVLTVRAKAIDQNSNGSIEISQAFAAGGSKSTYVSGTEWKEYKIEFKSLANVEHGQVKLIANQVGSGVIFDNVKIVEKGTGLSIIIDGGFDTWNGWAGVNGEFAAVIPQSGYAGFKDALGRWVDNPGYVVPAGAGAWQTVSLYKPDTDYVLTVMAKALDENSYGSILVNHTFAAGGSKSVDVLGTEWKEYRIVFKSLSVVNHGQIQLKADQVGNGAVFDNVRLFEVNSEPTPTPTPQAPTVILTGDSMASAGWQYNVNVSVTDVIGAYAADITVDYDADLFDFISASKANEETQIIEVSSSIPGKLRIILVNVNGMGGSYDLLNLKFIAKDVLQTTSGTISISKAQFGTAPEGAVIEAELSEIAVTVTSMDLNGNGSIDIGDFAIVVYHYRKDTNSSDWDIARIGDVNGDGIVDIGDLALIANRILGH